MAREYFNFYHSYVDGMSQLSDEEVGRLVRALAKYSQTGELPKLPGNERFVADFMVSQIDRDNKRYLQKCDKQRENVKKRWDTDGAKAADDGKKDTMVYDGIKPAEDGGDDTKDTKEKEKEKTKTMTKTKEMEKEKEKEEEEDKEKDKEKEKEKEKEKTQAPEAQPIAKQEEEEDDSPVFITLPLNDGEEFPITEKMVWSFRELYPSIDVKQNLKTMRGWCLGNPGSRKPKNDILRFIHYWLSKEQGKAPKSTRRGFIPLDSSDPSIKYRPKLPGITRL